MLLQHKRKIPTPMKNGLKFQRTTPEKVVLTMEWLDVIKLNNDAAFRDASLN